MCDELTKLFQNKAAAVSILSCTLRENESKWDVSVNFNNLKNFWLRAFQTLQFLPFSPVV